MKNNRQLLLISEPNSYRIAAFLSAAKRMRIKVLIASQGEYSLTSEVHDGLHIDLSNPQSALSVILKQARRTPFIGILGIDDSTVELAARVAGELGFAHNPADAARLTRRKDLARAHLAQAGCNVPTHRLIDLEKPLSAQIEDLRYPCVIKPLALSASRGVIRCDDADSLISACGRVEHILIDTRDTFEKQHLLVEAYIDGVEVAYEGYLQQGHLNTLVIFDKPDPLIGPYFEETIYVTPSSLTPEIQAKIKQQLEMACCAYGLATGPVHAELRINEAGAWILEVAARTIGGDCARVLDSGSGFNLEELVISLAVDRPYTPEPPDKARGVMMIPIRSRGILRRVEGQTEASKVANVENIEIYARAGNELIPLPEGNQYPGFIFARADRPEEVITALRSAYEKLNFVVAPLINTRMGAAE